MHGLLTHKNIRIPIKKGGYFQKLSEDSNFVILHGLLSNKNNRIPKVFESAYSLTWLDATLSLSCMEIGELQNWEKGYLNSEKDNIFIEILIYSFKKIIYWL